MAAERHPDDAVEASDPSVEQDAPEEAPAGASSDEPGGEQAPFSGAEQRQRAGAAAAYAAAKHNVPPKADAESDGDQPAQQAQQPHQAEQPHQAQQPHQPQQPQSEDDPEQQMQQDLEELALKAEKADEYLQLAQRTQADFENYRKRAAREAALAQERGAVKLAKELLPAIDSLDRALQAASEAEPQIAEGIKLVHTDLLSALQRVGIEPFSPQGEPFDPQYHEAVAQQPVDGVDSGVVAEVFQQGYRLGESVLRPARVLVAA